MKKLCTICDRTLPISSFGLTGNGYRRRYCSTCKTYRFRDKDPDRWLQSRQEIRRKRRLNIPQTILEDCRKSDRKKSRDNDLDILFVKLLVENPCEYCGEDELRMTLDRVDNHVGHLKSNVVPACIRCNYARGNMPYAAWLRLIPGMKEARLAGEFGTWTGRMSFNTK